MRTTLYLCCLLMALNAMPLSADDARPLHIEIREMAESAQRHNYKVQWRVPPLVLPANYPALDLPAHCQLVTAPNAEAGPLALSQSPTLAQKLLLRIAFHQPQGLAMVSCDQVLAGQTLQLRYPRSAPALSTLVKFLSQNGERHTQVLKPGQRHWQLPAAESTVGVARDYTVLGIEHIWAGWDHLLFVVCLIWIAGSGRRVLVTITGFTIAHSITLVLSALRWVQVPVPPVEAAIALSIVFLAVEILKQRRDSLTWRYPIAVSSSFGLLHGFGFAAALKDIGLPQTELLTGLLFFNVGVEIGQLIFAGVVMALMVGFQQMGRLGLGQTYQGFTRRLCCYGVGSLASFWLFERLGGF